MELFSRIFLPTQKKTFAHMTHRALSAHISIVVCMFFLCCSSYYFAMEIHMAGGGKKWTKQQQQQNYRNQKQKCQLLEYSVVVSFGLSSRLLQNLYMLYIVCGYFHERVLW